jgi:hypothetical protein
MEVQRQKRGFVRPIFEQSALALAAPGGAVEQAAVIGAEPREDRQIMGADEHVDAVDLVQAEPFDRAAEVALIDRIRPRPAEAQRRERDAPRLGERKV